MDSSLPERSLTHERERAVELICRRFGEDQIDLHRLETMLDQAYKATTVGEVRSLIETLPAPADPSPPVAEDRDTQVTISSVESAGHRNFIALMGGTVQRGPWSPPRKVNIVAVMGGIEIDFREASFQPGVTEIYAVGLMGGVEIIVPPGLHVDCHGIGIMGGFESESTASPPRDPQTPVLRIRGIGMMGAVEIQERQVGETAGDARRRKKLERKQRRLSS